MSVLCSSVKSGLCRRLLGKVRDDEIFRISCAETVCLIYIIGTHRNCLHINILAFPCTSELKIVATGC